MALSKIPLRRKALVLDTTAFYAVIPFTGTSKYYTTPSVIREVSHNQTLSMAISALIESNRLIIIEPLNDLIEEVRLTASKSGDLQKLSNTDISVIALGMQLKRNGYYVTIVSDDYSIQNVVKFSGLNFSPIMTRGISRTIRWFLYCSGCGKVFYDSSAIVCDVCGTRLKRKMRRDRF
ncbi:MAG: nucleotide-binding protein [archaeon]|nr:nucleotide-binding protein [archaeon]